MQVHSQVFRFGGKINFWGKIFCFVIALIKIILGTTIFKGTKKIWGALPPNVPPWLQACSNSLLLGISIIFSEIAAFVHQLFESL